MIEIKEVKTRKELKQFVKFPFLLYKNSPYWVPPIIKEELDSLDKTKNPVFKNAEAQYFLAYKNGIPVGRIAVIINWIEVRQQKKSKLRFGWFDAVDDIAVTKKLLEKAIAFGKQYQLKTIEGPVGFSNLDKAGLLSFGFKELNTMVTWYNHSYYAKHFEQLGYKKAAEWVEYKIRVPNSSPKKVEKFSEIILERYKLRVLKFNSSKEIIQYTDQMFDLLNKTYNKLQSFVPIQQEQINHYKEKYIRFIHPDFVNGILDQNNTLVAFAITMPSFSKALKKMNGKLFPFGFRQLLKARKKNDTASFYLIGVHPKYQSKGVTAIIFKEMINSFNKHHIKKVETNPELEENKAIQALWKNFDYQLHKRRKTFKKDLG